MNRRNFLKFSLGAGAFALLWSSPQVRFFKEPGPPLCSPPPNYARFMATGDIMVHQTLLDYARQADGSYDFKPFLKYVRPILLQADVLFGNLETPLAGAEAKFTGYPNFNAPDELADALAWAGYKVLSVANNHALDRNWSGLIKTTEKLKERKLLYVGAFQSAEDKKEPRVAKTIGPTLGFLAYTYGVNGPHKNPAHEPWRLNFIKDEQILDEVKELKPKADIIIVSLHFGPEYQRWPSKTQTALVEKLLTAKVDLVLGHHPHVLQPVWGGGETMGHRAAIFSLGNFLSTQNQPFADHGLIFDCQIGFDQKGDKVLGPVTLHSTRCLKCVEDGQRVFRIVPTAAAIEHPKYFGLTDKHYQKLSRERDVMAELILSHGTL